MAAVGWALVFWVAGALPGAATSTLAAAAASDPAPTSPASPASPVPPGPEATAPGARLLYGIGLHLGLGEDQFEPTGASSGGTSAFGLGLYLRVGAQLGDLWGVEGEVSGATIIVQDYGRVAITLDITPLDWLTVAVGPTARVDFSGLCMTTTADSLGATVRLDFHIDPTLEPSGRSGLTLGLVGDLGATVGAGLSTGAFSGPGLSYGIYLTAGYARY